MDGDIDWDIVFAITASTVIIILSFILITIIITIITLISIYTISIILYIIINIILINVLLLIIVILIHHHTSYHHHTHHHHTSSNIISGRFYKYAMQDVLAYQLSTHSALQQEVQQVEALVLEILRTNPFPVPNSNPDVTRILTEFTNNQVGR